MNTAIRTTRTGWVTLAILATAATAGRGLAAQEIVTDRFEAAAPALEAALRVPPSPPPAQQPRAPFLRVLAGTTIGGVIGAAVGGGVGAAIGSLDEDPDAWISSTAALGALGFVTGYPLGAAIGARWGATVDGARPDLNRLAVLSYAGVLAGGFVWNRVGEAFESPYNMRSWYIGAAAGALTHLALTALVAQQSPAEREEAEAAPGNPDG